MLRDREWSELGTPGERALDCLMLLACLALPVGCGSAPEWRPYAVRPDPRAGVVGFSIAIARPWPEEPGMAHLLEHLFLRGEVDGKPHRPRVRIASLGGRVEAYTAPDRIAWNVTVPAAHWGEALDLLLAGFAARWPEREVRQELRVIEAERRLSSPRAEAWRALARETFRPSGLDVRFQGWPRFDAARVAAEAPRYLRRARAVAVAAGELDPGEFALRLARNWERLGQREAPRAPPHPGPGARPTHGRVEASGAVLHGFAVPGGVRTRGRDSALQVLAAALPRASYRRFAWGGLFGVELSGSVEQELDRFAVAPQDEASGTAVKRWLLDRFARTQLDEALGGAIARWLLERETAAGHAAALAAELLLPPGCRVDPASLHAVRLGSTLQPVGGEQTRPLLLRRDRRWTGSPARVRLPGGRKLVLLPHGAVPVSRVALRIVPPAPLSPGELALLAAYLRQALPEQVGGQWSLVRRGSRLLAHAPGGPELLGRLAGWLRGARAPAGSAPPVASAARLRVEQAVGAVAGRDSPGRIDQALRDATLAICGWFDAERAHRAAAERTVTARPVTLRSGTVATRPGFLPRLYLGYRWPVGAAPAVAMLEAELRLWSIERLIQGEPALYRVRLERGAGWSVWELAGLDEGLAMARVAFASRLAALGRQPLERLDVLGRMRLGELALAGDSTRAGLAAWFDVDQFEAAERDAEAVRRAAAGLVPHWALDRSQ